MIECSKPYSLKFVVGFEIVFNLLAATLWALGVFHDTNTAAAATQTHCIKSLRSDWNGKILSMMTVESRTSPSSLHANVLII